MLTLYGYKGCGNVIIEAACELLGEPYRFVEAAPWKPSPAVDELKKVNPLVQIPTLVAGGTVITESVAILLWLLERHPGNIYAPAPSDPRRGTFLRWLVYFPGNIYPMFTVGDHPDWWVDGEEPQKRLKKATVDHTLRCWSVLEESLKPDPYLLGSDLTMLDVQAAVMTIWRPGRAAIRGVAPRVVAAAERTEDHPLLAPIFARNFTAEMRAMT